MLSILQTFKEYLNSEHYNALIYVSVVKEPPFSLRSSGYAGFTLPIEIYLRNNQEPKKIWFNYEIVLQPSGPPIHNVQKDKYVFHNPSDEFRSRLLKGGALVSIELVYMSIKEM